MGKVIIVGSGFSGLSAAAYLSAAGHEVLVFEKNASPGGRARQLRTNSGYVFDMGPSWYWMPDVFERFFNDFGYTVADFYQLDLLNPAFEIVFAGEKMTIPDNPAELYQLFESIETGSAVQLQKFLTEARYKYETGMQNLVYKPMLSVTELANASIVNGSLRLQVFTSLSNHVRKHFTHPKLIALMEFPVLFLGAMPQDIPAMYSLMNYACLKLGTWYPRGGFGKIIEAIVKVAETNSTKFYFNAPVEKIILEQDRACGIVTGGKRISCDAVIAAADYHHVENDLLGSNYRNYKESYWHSRTFAPSCLIYYVGITKKLQNLKHHTLFFEEDLLLHSTEIFKDPKWPSKPLFYVCCPSVTDASVAPDGKENLFFLMPIAPGLEDNDSLRENYFNIMLTRLQNHIGEDITPHIEFKKSYCIHDFISDYNSYKGNAYGLANTLRQTAVLKPRVRNRKIRNLFYAGQLTVPGPGVPPALISGKIAADQLLKYFRRERYEASV